MAIQRKPSLIEQAKSYIIDEIRKGIYHSGEKLAPVRELTSKLGVSHVTTATAIKELAREGWLDVKPGVGTFVSSRIPDIPERFVNGSSKLEKRALYFFFGNDPDNSYHSEILCSLQPEAEKNGWQLKISMLADSTTVAKAEQDDSAVGIIVSSAGLKINSICPAIYYGMSPSFPSTSCICVDNYQGGFWAGKLLFQKNYRNTYYITALDSTVSPAGYVSTHFADRWHGLRDFYRQQNIELSQPLAWSLVKGQTGSVEELLESIQKSSVQEKTALVVGNRSMAMEIYQQAEKMGLKIPDDLGMVSFIHRSQRDIQFPISTFDFSREDMARQICLMLKQKLDGYNLPSRIQIPFEFQDENSF